mmetsp:Transcript_10265/g.18865  ORF Transcript_10265/g.18865 Transcript_10265/m.18865 type:complete len:444 (-) Transcript_10265:120-1451(-)
MGAKRRTGRSEESSTKASVQRAQAELSRSRKVDFLIENGVWMGAVVLCIALAAALYVNIESSKLVEYLEVDQPEQLQEVFFGGSPWLVLCKDSRKALSKDDTLRETFVEGARLLADTKMAKAGVIDCSATLPSGNTVYERLKLNKTLSPVLFLAQGGDRPTQLNPAVLKKPKLNAKEKKQAAAAPNKEAYLGRPIANSVKKLYKARYLVTEVNDLKSLQTKCMDRKACALMLGYGSLNPASSALARHERKLQPLLRWAYLDVSKFQLSSESELMGGKKFNQNAMRLVLFRNGKFKTFPYIKSQGNERDMRHFLRDNAKSPLDDFQALQKLPTLKRKAVQLKSKSRSEKSGSSRTTKDDGPVKLTPEEARKAQLERERLRRKQMEEESQAFEPIASEEADDETDDEGNWHKEGYEQEEDTESIDEIDMDDEEYDDEDEDEVFLG